jgi:hypothetical protein
MAFTESQRIAIAELAIYIPAFAVGAFLSIRHGFGRNIGWIYVVIFTLCRIIGSGMTVGTISQPQNVSLYYGAAVLQNVGLSPLILVLLGLLGRVLESIRRSGTSFFDSTKLRIIQLLTLVGLILTAVGGSQAAQDYSKTGVYSSTSIQKAGMGLMIAAYGLLVLFTVVVATQVSQAEAGEKRLILAIALSLPFLLVRLVYSGMSIFSNNPAFIQYGGSFNPNIHLGMMVIMEMVIVAIIEAVGLTLRKIPKSQVPQTSSGGRWSRLLRSSQESQESQEMGKYEQRNGASDHV